MTLTVPDTDDLLVEMRETAWADVAEEDFADLMLQRATDLFHIATGLSEDPVDDTAFRIMQTGILVMAHALFVRSKDDDAILSPFQSERLGSYSYSKIVSQATNKKTTGVDWFDAAVLYFTTFDATNEGFLYGSETVFQQTYPGFVQEIYQGDKGFEGQSAADKWPWAVEPDVAGG